MRPPTALHAAALRAFLAKGPVEFRAAGFSMRPRLQSGDTVRVARRRPRRGDVVLAVAADGRLLLHRAVRLRRDALLLQGDAHLRPDGWVAAADVLGVAVAYRAGCGASPLAWHPIDGPLERWRGLAGARLRAVLRRLRAGRGTTELHRSI